MSDSYRERYVVCLRCADVESNEAWIYYWDSVGIRVIMFSCRSLIRVFFFFFQAEDGIRDLTVTGVQTCALPICSEVDADIGRPDPQHGRQQVQDVEKTLIKFSVGSRGSYIRGPEIRSELTSASRSRSPRRSPGRAPQMASPPSRMCRARRPHRASARRCRPRSQRPQRGTSERKSERPLQHRPPKAERKAWGTA